MLVTLLWARDGGICWICDREVDLSAKFPEPLSRSLDHVIALANGGTHTLGNVATAHLWCNISKKDRLFSHLPSWFVREGEEDPDAMAAQSA